MSNSTNPLARVPYLLLDILEPLREAIASGRLDLFLAECSWRIRNVDIEQIATSVDAVAQAIRSTKVDGIDNLGDLAETLSSLEKLGKEISSLATSIIDSMKGSSSSTDFGTLPGSLATDILNALAIMAIKRNNTRLYRVLQILGFISELAPTPLSSGGNSAFLQRFAIPRPTFCPEVLHAWLKDPGAHIGSRLGFSGAENQADAERIVRSTFRPIGALAEEFDARVTVALNYPPLTEEELRIARSATFIFTLPDKTLDPTLTALFGVNAEIRPPLAGGPGGLALTPSGSLTYEYALAAGDLKIKFIGSVVTVFFPADGDSRPYLEGSNAAGIEFGVTYSHRDDQDSEIVLGARTMGLIIKAFHFNFDAQLKLETPKIPDISISGSLDNAKLVIDAHSGDGFLARVLPPNGLSMNLKAGLIWSWGRGLSFTGSAGLEATLPVNINFFDMVTIDSIYFSLSAKGNEKEGGIQVVMAPTVKVKMGAVSALVEQFGLQATLSLPEKGGNLGVANLDLGFQHPKGVALSIDAGVVVGGGFLFFDPVNQQYGGMVHLEIAESLNLNAIGLITTRLPDGSPGFSMLVLIAVEFAPPIQLGYGFALKGIGGILGVNRTVAVEVLRSGLRAGTLGSILLPQDPLANAPKIISDLNTVFPPAEGRFVFGPMILLAWGPNNLIQLQIGLVLELPAPARLFILGRLRVLLPEEKHPIVKLQLDALGVIDFGNGDISLDAVLYDSEIKGFVITGEMALRANVGATPGFVLAVGGFHPAFPAPSGFPALKRVTISLATGDNPRLRLAAYFALTTNTVQFGASLDFLVEAGPFSVEGRFTFDALIQFAPFGLAVSMTAMVAIKAGTTVLLAVQLDLSLTGPTPWHIWGKAHFQLLFISVTVDFDATIGQEQPPPLPPPVDIRPLLLAALKELRNWGTQLPQGEHPLVVLREAQQAQPETTQGTEPPSLFVHPLADLHVSQQVVPFDREVTKFGNTIPEGEREYTLLVKNEKDKWVSPESEGSSAKGLVWLTDKFAPAQFRTMSDDEKLRAPAFEDYRSGVRFSFGGYACGEPVIEEQAEYEESATVRPPQEEGAATLVAITLPTAYVLTPSFLQQMARIGSVGQATMHHSGRAKFRQEFLQSSKKQGITIKPRMFEVYDRKGVASSAPSKTNGESFFAKLESVTKPRGDLRWEKPRTRVRPKLATVGNE